MPIDPFSGLDPNAPATTLRKTVRYVYTPPVVVPVPVLTPPATPPTEVSTEGGITITKYLVVDSNTGTAQYVTYEEFLRRR